jgi:hypothetical protein
MRRSVAIVFLAAVSGLLGVGAGCAGWLARSEGIERSTLPDTVLVDYDLFALRCSKCHSLARPLSSGIDDDDYWAIYVAKMRRQPGSGISQEDTVGILRFLHYYSLEQKKKKERHDESPPPAASPSPPVAPPPTAAPPPPASSPPPSAMPSSPAASLREGGARGHVF